MPYDPTPKAHDGLIHTLTEPVEVDALGLTLVHQHILFYHSGEYYLNDEARASEQVRLFAQDGGSTIVELSCAGLRLSNDLSPLYRISCATGVKFVASVGYYKYDLCSKNGRAWFNPSLTAYQIRDQMLVELIGKGIFLDSGAHRTIWGGIIGELGVSPMTSSPLFPFESTFEARNLAGAALAHLETGAPINIHFDGPRVPEETNRALKIILDHGVRPSRIALSHRVSSSLANIDEDIRLAKMGVYLEYDWFIVEAIQGGLGLSESASCSAPYFRRLIEEGCLDRILVSPDVLNTAQYDPPFGYTYSRRLLTTMLDYGLTKRQLDAILIANPARFLCWSL